ncbi:hypothetical protein ACIQZG_00070 [Lysinibacillus sp. NPDC096418]|uniref:hypothetical protein n=1 Tax=Lysinibacillus sp. NPDC096418 TaxID=3364138 RepID=UPI0037FF9527
MSYKALMMNGKIANTPFKKDTDVTEDELKQKSVIFVGLASDFKLFAIIKKNCRYRQRIIYSKDFYKKRSLIMHLSRKAYGRTSSQYYLFKRLTMQLNKRISWLI